MLKNLQLTNFRGFEQLELKQLNRVNLIVGDNNTGKTSILEALYLLHLNSRQLEKFATAFRSVASSGFAGSAEEVDRFWLWLFRNHSLENVVSVIGEDDKGEPCVVRFLRDEVSGIASGLRSGWLPSKQMLSFASGGKAEFGDFAAPGPSVRRLSSGHSDPVEDAELYNSVVVKAGGEEAMHEFLRIAESRLQKLRYLKLHTDSDALIYAQVGNIPELVPSTQLGQAFTRLLHIFCEIKSHNPAVFLADEIENGIYHGKLQSFWSALLALTESSRTQIFATTHSFECMKAAHLAACERADNGGTYDLNIIRLDRVDWGIKATEFGRETMEVAIANGWEMR